MVLRTAFRQTTPILLFHIPLGIVCGVLYQEAGYPWYVAPIFSFFVFAAAMQFLTISILASGGSLLLLAISLIPVGLRNVFYGLTMIKRYEKAPPLLKGYLAHSLIDGVYSLLQTGPRFEGKKDIRYVTIVSALSHSSWVLGTLCGSIAANFLPIPPKLEFSLTAFFAAAALEVFLKQKQKRVVMIGFLSLALALLLLPRFFLPFGVLLAAFGCVIVPQKAEVAL